MRLPSELPALSTTACVLVVMLGWGVAFFVNSISVRLLGGHGFSLWLMLLWQSIGRIAGLIVAIPVIWTTGDNTDRSNLVITWNFAAPFIAGLLVNVAFIPYFFLSNETEVSVLTVMTGLHSVIPAIWGILVWREDRTLNKVVGIVLSFTAILILNVGDAQSLFGSAVPPVQIIKTCLFLATVAMWGAADIYAACVKISPMEAAIASLLSNMTTAVVFGSAFAVDVLRRESSLTCDDVEHMRSTPPLGWAHTFFLVSNALGVIGTLAYIRLVQLGQLSIAAPLVSLYVYVPVLLAVVVLGEQLTALKLLGIIVAGGSLVLLSSSESTRRSENYSNTQTSLRL